RSSLDLFGVYFEIIHNFIIRHLLLEIALFTGERSSYLLPQSIEDRTAYIRKVLTHHYCEKSLIMHSAKVLT
ncbi:MAG: hypothetical protein ACTSYU_08675, partial [Promethearchaeota archaeon]